jgi:hypothetical protein
MVRKQTIVDVGKKRFGDCSIKQKKCRYSIKEVIAL